jgi:uncharacterized protein
MTVILYRHADFELELRDDGDGRTISGLVVPYNSPARVGGYVESFTLGAFRDADPEQVPLLAVHDHASLPIGRAMTLAEEDRGLAGSFRVSETRAGDEVLTLIRDGAVRGLSVGFIPLPGGDRWSADRTRVERTRARLIEVSVTPWPIYDAARIAAVRAAVAPATPRLRLARRQAA